MKVLLPLIVFFFASLSALADTGVVVKINDSKYAIEYSGGYLLVEWYGGYEPTEGDSYVGGFNNYGMKELYCTNSEQETKFWIENFMSSEDEMLEYLYD